MPKDQYKKKKPTSGADKPKAAGGRGKTRKPAQGKPKGA